jgi:predicted RNA-binding Zn-ribbon protein involved in translation (DUF1610 family)
MTDKTEIITNQNQINEEAIYSCTKCSWQGKYNQRARKRDEEKKGFYLICPKCGCDTFNKLEQKLFTMRTFSVSKDITNIVRQYNAKHGLSYRQAS